MSAVEDTILQLRDTDRLFAAVRSSFPYFEQHPNLVYLDSAASAQKPRRVIDAISNYHAYSHANIHRGVYKLSQEATEKYELARSIVARFINASPNEIIFTRGTTECFNLLAHSYVGPHLSPGDEVLISIAEHHANIIPWQLICQAKGATLKALPLTEDHHIDLGALDSMISEKTKFISITHLSNVLGTLTDVEAVVRAAKKYNIPVALDGAQSIAHIPIDVQALGCDFYAFSGHKLYGPTGIGVLYGRHELLAEMPPYQGGGDMIESVTIESSTYQAPPQRFEAGTPNIAGAVGLAESIRFVSEIGFANIVEHDRTLQSEVTELLLSIPGLRTFGPDDARVGAVSFIADWGHPHDIGTILDTHNVAVRTGHHCAQPLMEALGVGSTTRVSFGVYNTTEELKVLKKALLHAHSILR